MCIRDRNADGSYEYTPNAGFSGEDTFEYCIDDGNGGEDVATVTITVGEEPNTAPEAADDKVETAYATAVDGDALANDTDVNGDDLTATLLDGPDNGELVFNDDGTYTYTPAPGFSGEDVFTYEISDGNGGTSTAEVCITVAPRPNEGPDAADDKVETDFQTEVTGNVTINDADPDGDDLSVRLLDAPASGDLVLNQDGSFSFTPEDGFSGEVVFTYEISDGNGGTDVAEVCITVGEEPNDAPEAIDDKLETVATEETIFTYTRENPPGSDAGGDIQSVTTSFNETTNELAFQLVVDGDTNGFTLAINDGPNPKGNGDELALFYFDNSGSEPVITAYNYNGENNFSSFRDGAPIVSSLSGDSPFSDIQVTTDAAGNTVFSFAMDATTVQEFSDSPDWNGVAFSERLGMWLHPMEGLQTSYGADGFLESWNFESQGYFDVANEDATSEVITEIDPVQTNVLTNDSDSDGDSLVVTAVNGESTAVGAAVAGSDGGTFTIGADGELTFDGGSDFDDLEPGETRRTTITYTVDDGNGGTSTATVCIDVTAPEAGSLSGRFFADTDGNLRDNNNGDEPPVEGVLVMLLDTVGTPTGDQVFTDANGEYSFDGLAPGEYSVKFTDPNGVLEGAQLIEANRPGFEDRDSDAIGDVNESVIEGITVVNGEDTADNDAGVEDAPEPEPELVKQQANFESLSSGTRVTDQIPGVSISAQFPNGATADAMVFDSNNPTGGDTDLRTSGQGNILIISEDGDSSDPDDNARGGTFSFDFDQASSVESLNLIDTEEGGVVRLYGEDGSLIDTVTIPRIGDGEVGTLDINVDGVARMDVVMNGSGAIDDICFTSGVEAPSTGLSFTERLARLRDSLLGGS